MCAHYKEMSIAMEGAGLLTDKPLDKKDCDPKSCKDFRTCRTTTLRWEFKLKNFISPATDETERIFEEFRSEKLGNHPDCSFPVGGYVNALLQTLTKLRYMLKAHSLYTSEFIRYSTWVFQVEEFIPGKIA